ncbi:hypothetical protein DMN91_005756 [Ooceraea biroi]|uniref:Uncharacterized protein n=2 Tax=Ooceraea biroi TaxID=2015173 RepID=A0A3L8DME0_OOCBI|nr:hypothetical protein DMN91_005756 [Ooceraea biroi]
MLQTMPRVSVAGLRRRWGNKHNGNLQESSPEVSSTDTFSSNFQVNSGSMREEDLQLWDLDLHRGLRTQSNTDHYRAITTNSSELSNNDRPTSPFSISTQGKCNQ